MWQCPGLAYQVSPGHCIYQSMRSVERYLVTMIDVI
jgi:hypothetical protein